MEWAFKHLIVKHLFECKNFSIRLLSVQWGDKNHISVSTHIASVYIKISLVLFGTVSSWKLTHSAPYPLWAANLFGAISFQARNPLYDRHGQHSFCLAMSSCIWLCVSVLCLNSPNLPSSSVQVSYQFFSQAIVTAATNFLNSDFIFNSGSPMKRLNSSKQWCTKSHFSMTTFLENWFVKSAIWLVIDQINV